MSAAVGLIPLRLIRPYAPSKTRRFFKLPGLSSKFTLILPVVHLTVTFYFSGGHFINSVTGDYAAGFLGSAEGCNWNMKPFDVR